MTTKKNTLLSSASNADVVTIVVNNSQENYSAAMFSYSVKQGSSLDEDLSFSTFCKQSGDKEAVIIVPKSANEKTLARERKDEIQEYISNIQIIFYEQPKLLGLQYDACAREVRDLEQKVLHCFSTLNHECERNFSSALNKKIIKEVQAIIEQVDATKLQPTSATFKP